MQTALSLEASIADVIDPPWTNLEPVRVGATPPGRGTPTFYVAVSRAGSPFMRVDAFLSASDEADTFTETVIWGGWLVVGYGERVSLVGLETRAVVELPLHSYFGSFFQEGDCLLAASAQHLVRLRPDGTVAWSSCALGIDGVVVDRIESGVIHGQGEWNPPGGWKRFTLDLASGHRG